MTETLELLPVESETAFALCDSCQKADRGCEYIHKPRLACPMFMIDSSHNIESVAKGLTDEFFQAHGDEALTLLAQMRQLSNQTPPIRTSVR